MQDDWCHCDNPHIVNTRTGTFCGTSGIMQMMTLTHH